MTIDLMGEWLEEKGTDPILLEILIEYARAEARSLWRKSVGINRRRHVAG